MSGPAEPAPGQPDFDVIVVGAGIGGIYAVHRFQERGLSVLGFEGADGVGGVWYHNGYPGARVDVESYYYCYFDPELYDGWTWTERYPSQPEILAYLNFVADRYRVKPRFRFSTWVTGARWDPAAGVYRVRTDRGDEVSCRYLVMTSGQLSRSRDPEFSGLEDFAGEWVQTSHWPQGSVDLAGRRIGVVGTGSSGVQAVTALAEVGAELLVFQRTANYSVPAHNGPIDREKYAGFSRDLPGTWRKMLAHPGGTITPTAAGPASDFTERQRLAVLEDRWAFGGHAMGIVFSDQGTNLQTNALVSDFVRDKVRQVVKDPALASQLVATAYPIGSRRLCVDTGYFESFNQDNVTLVDIKADPLRRITRRGIMTRDRHYDLDLIIFALGFDAFTGALDAANISNARGRHPSDNWRRGPQTYLGLMTADFPNLFLVTAPGSPSVLANMVVGNVHHVDFIADCIGYMREHQYTRVEPTWPAQTRWTQHVADLSENLIRRTVANYMVHVNDDGSRVFMPYVGGLNTYVEACARVVENDYEGFAFS